MINIFVACGNKDVTVESDSELTSDRKADVVQVFVRLFIEDPELVSIEEGLKKVEQYGIDYDCKGDNWTEAVEEYKEMIGDSVGKFYIWSVESDLNLMFVEDGEELPEFSEEFE